MKLAARAVSLAGGRMIGLAPSKKAATVFGRDVGVDAFTIDGFLTAHRAAIQAGEEISERYRIGSGDVVVIDEAAMATSASLDEVVQLVTNAGDTCERCSTITDLRRWAPAVRCAAVQGGRRARAAEGVPVHEPRRSSRLPRAT